MNLIIKGIIIGIGKIIPGVSGSLLAMSLGVYEQLLSIISNIKDKFMGNIYFLTKIGFGIILSIILTSKIVVKCLEFYYLPTMLLFIGMIIGGLPNILKKVNPQKNDIPLLLIATIITIYILTMNNLPINNYKINYTLVDFFKIIIIGFVDAFSSVVPGISGTALLMMIGYYNTILETFSTLVDSDRLNHNVFILIPFFIGFIIGVIITSKILNYLFKKYKNKIYIIIAIFMFITTLILIKNVFSSSYTLLELIIGILLFILGYIISLKLEKK